MLMQSIRKSSFLDKALILIAVCTLLFFTTMIIIFCVIGSVPDSLIDAFKDIICVELGSGGLIQIAKARKQNANKSGVRGESEIDPEEL